MHQQLSRNWQLAAQIGGDARVQNDVASVNIDKMISGPSVHEYT